MPGKTENLPHALIAAIIPYFLERGVLWYEEHFEDIRRKTRRDEWWRDHTIFLEPGSRNSFSPFLRKLADMGYVKAGRVESRGEFATRGGIVDVFPINLDHPVRIEFSGNIVESIFELKAADEPKPLKIAKPKDATDYERLWLSGLKSEDYLVHIDHGIGIFVGIVGDDENATSSRAGVANTIHQARLKAGPSHNSYYMLEYAPSRRGGIPDRLLIPRWQAKKLSRYIGFETPVIHRLGGTIWETTKRRAKDEAKKFAEELIAVFRARAQADRSPYPRHPETELHLAHSFSYEETPDQIRTLNEIHADLSAAKPMDRLILGDVGFGKTELAVRAAARVAYSGKQVAVLAPTTILADQHHVTFRMRLKDLPFEIVTLTRLTPKKNQKIEIDAIKNGKADIVIGTHRLLSPDVVWLNLGLLIIDEEQRFGVGQKEKLKKMRREIDILSLTATPIPRTLSIALSKFKELSLIQDPPTGRLAIRTFVLPFSDKTVAEAIAQEIKRGGQIFYLWNRIESIESVRRNIEQLAPQAVVAVLHGRMKETELIRVMHEFRLGKIDILLATTIIENGLDLPNANTLIVANAVRLGLSQAYQIRGRIGRGEIQAYAYFLYSPRSLTQKGKLRLQALKETQGLGAGFQIALKDLEIRGAGNILGKQQSGTINRVGLNLYAQLLSEALDKSGNDQH